MPYVHGQPWSAELLIPGHKSRRILFLLFLLALFSFRLWFGTVSPFFTDDEKQIYLIGLKFYTTHQWPYFGPEVGWEAGAPLPPVQIPGALQGLVVGLPFFVYPIAEAPYVFLNLLSFAALCLLAWYCQRRLPEIPPWIIWTWLMTAPWMMSMSTNMINISYVLPGGVLFFVGFLEILPQTTRGLVPLLWANFMMGFALFWVMQFHLSWVALVPFVLLAFYCQASSRPRQLLRSTVAFLCGSLLTAIFLLPTYLKFGLGRGTGGTLKVVTFDRFAHPRQLIATGLNVLSRLLSLASFEVPRFIGAKTASRGAFLHEHEWMTPFVIFLGIAGILQPIAMLVLWFKRQNAHRDWPAIKWLMLGTVGLFYVLCVFSFRDPLSRDFYISLPLTMIYSLYAFSAYLTRRGWQIFAGVFLVCGIIFHVGLGLHNREHYSMYVNRGIPEAALRLKDYHILGERRPGSR